MKMATLLLASMPFVAVTAHAEEWKYDAVLYAWLTGLEGTIGVADVVQQPVSASFDDLLEYVDFAMAGHFEAKDSRMVLITDIAYFNLGSERDATVMNQPVTIDMDFKEWIFELGGGYRLTPEFDVVLAGRWYVFESGLEITSQLGESLRASSHNWGDVYVGARYRKTFEKWIAAVRGDIGTGGSEFAWFANAMVAYRINEKVSAGIAWRALGLDREPDTLENDYLLYDINQSGLGVGVGFSF